MEDRCELAEELIDLILSRSAVKSLMRFKCVNKAWLAKIRDPTFIALHLNHNRKNNKKNMVLFDVGRANFFLISSDGLCPTKLTGDIMQRDCVDDEHLEHLCHCDGIICLYGPKGGKLIMCNPLTKEHILLPEVSSRHEDVFPVPMGIGYDKKSRRYKVVRLMPSLVVELHMLGSDGWREVQSNTDNILKKLGEEYGEREMELKHIYPEHYQICTNFNGALHWVAVYLGENKHASFILSFNLGDERFEVINLRYPFMALCYENFPLVWNGCFGMLSRKSSEQTNVFELLVMKEYGIKESWTIMFKTELPHMGICKPLLFCENNDGLLYSSRDGGEIFFYNLKRGEIKNLGFQNCEEASAVNYVSSIVSLEEKSSKLETQLCPSFFEAV